MGGQGLVGPLLDFALDDFLVIGPPDDQCCLILLATIQHVFQVFSVWLVQDKTEGPGMVLKFLGIIIDIDLMECYQAISWKISVCRWRQWLTALR